jgi:3'-5' exoribonuclease
MHFSEGDSVSAPVVVDSFSLDSTASSKSPYTKLTVRFKDQTVLEVRRWGEHWNVKTGQVIVLDGQVEMYKGSPQIKAWSFKESDEIPEAFLPRVPDDEHALNKAQLSGSINRIENESLKGFATFCMKHEQKRFLLATGAIGNHHALIRGLTKHTAEMIKLASVMVDMYIDVQLDRDLVFAALPLHDWGKMEEYGIEGASFVMTDRGKMHSHPGITPVRLAELRVKYNEEVNEKLMLNDDLFFELLHTIMAHHGKVEYNAPSGPKTLPALVVHMADYCSCFGDAFKQACSGGERGDWTDRWIITPDGKWKLRRSGND